MINRLVGKIPEPDDEGPGTDCWEVSGEDGFFYVSEGTARTILGELRRVFKRRRLRFTDLFGSEVWIATRGVRCVSQSTSAQRASSRRFHRARRDERKAERRPWDDDDFLFE